MKKIGGEYWGLARQPLNALAFLAPLLLIYEVGVLWLATAVGTSQAESMRNGADHWMRTWLQQAGCEQAWLLPVLVVVGLLAWQLVAKQPWQISVPAQLGMWIESLLFACCLVLVGQLQDLAFREYHVLRFSSWLNITRPEVIPRAISFVGAGIYEEVLFRLCLLPLCYGALRVLLIPGKIAMVLAVIATSLLFSAAHYVGPAADQFTLFSFTFRAVAGLFFAILFVLRGFGITAGCHAAYDLMVGVVLTA